MSERTLNPFQHRTLEEVVQHNKKETAYYCKKNGIPNNPESVKSQLAKDIGTGPYICDSSEIDDDGLIRASSEWEDYYFTEENLPCVVADTAEFIRRFTPNQQPTE